jgi:hypothetical protein
VVAVQEMLRTLLPNPVVPLPPAGTPAAWVVATMVVGTAQYLPALLLPSASVPAPLALPVAIGRRRAGAAAAMAPGGGGGGVGGAHRGSAAGGTYQVLVGGLPDQWMRHVPVMRELHAALTAAVVRAQWPRTEVVLSIAKPSPKHYVASLRGAPVRSTVADTCGSSSAPRRWLSTVYLHVCMCMCGRRRSGRRRCRWRTRKDRWPRRSCRSCARVRQRSPPAHPAHCPPQAWSASPALRRVALRAPRWRLP